MTTIHLEALVQSTTETWCGMYTPQPMNNFHYMSEIVIMKHTSPQTFG